MQSLLLFTARFRYTKGVVFMVAQTEEEEKQKTREEEEEEEDSNKDKAGNAQQVHSSSQLWWSIILEFRDLVVGGGLGIWWIDMAASANPCGNQQDNSNNPQSQHQGSFNSGGVAGADNSGGRPHGLRHQPRMSLDWTEEEQSIVEQGLSKYASEPALIRYAKIALQLQDKSVRDVAMRCRWMTRKEIGKRRKDDHNLARKNKDKKERVIDPSVKSSSHLAVRTSVPSYALPMLPMDTDDGISFEAIGGETGQLLEQNLQLFNQISLNFTSYPNPDNVNLFCRARDNILSIMTDLNDMPGIMKQMPPLPVKVNEELANSLLPRTTLPRKKP